MKFKNIHNRSEFNKIYEIIGGTSGGLGQSDGFANNAKLKDTVLGKVINGLFKGISWLWKKSKEFFVINKLIAKLTNELLRGVILYCFTNNINLQTGEKKDSDQNQNLAQKPESDEDQQSEGEEGEEINVPTGSKFEPIRKEVEKIYANQGGFYPEKPSPQVLRDAQIPFSIDKVEDYNKEEYNKIEKEMYDFLNDNIDNYESMTDEQKKQIHTIYLNYEIIKNLKKEVEEEIVEEHFDLPKNDFDVAINEENVVNTSDKKIGSSGLVKPKLDNPEAGKVSLSKSISMKAGSAATVGDILTKRDRDKFSKNHSDEFKIDINEINLAEIEKRVEEDKAQEKVSSQVNPENLKTIQLAAQELFLPSKSEKESGSDKSKLQLKWNKELTKVYASFTRIMNIPDVDIRGEYKNELNSRVSKNSDVLVQRTRGQENAARISEHFGDILEEGEISFQDLKGKFAFMSFYTNEAYYNAAVEHIYKITNDFKAARLYLLKISKTFSEMKGDKSISNFDKFQNVFTAGNPDRNVYFLFINPQYKHASKISFLILNEDVKTNKLYLYYRDSVRKDLVIDIKEDNEIKNISSGKLDKKYLWNISIDNFKLFKLDLDKKWKDYFNLGKIDFHALVPAFYKDNDIQNFFKDISTKIRI